MRNHKLGGNRRYFINILNFVSESDKINHKKFYVKLLSPGVRYILQWLSSQLYYTMSVRLFST